VKTTYISQEQVSTKGEDVSNEDRGYSRRGRRLVASGGTAVVLLAAGCSSMHGSTTTAASPNGRPTLSIMADCTKGSYSIWNDQNLGTESVGYTIQLGDKGPNGKGESYSYLLKTVHANGQGQATSYDLQPTGWSDDGVDHPPTSTTLLHVALGQMLAPGQYFNIYAGTPNSTDPQNTNPSNLTEPGLTVACHLPLVEPAS
jgi:hypothetical protein